MVVRYSGRWYLWAANQKLRSFQIRMHGLHATPHRHMHAACMLIPRTPMDSARRKKDSTPYTSNSQRSQSHGSPRDLDLSPDLALSLLCPTIAATSAPEVSCMARQWGGGGGMQIAACRALAAEAEGRG